MTIALVQLTKGGGTCWVRVDHISELHEQQSTAVPFETVGTRLHLTTGRELVVSEMPVEVLDKMDICECALDGYFSSDDDG